MVYMHGKTATSVGEMILSIPPLNNRTKFMRYPLVNRGIISTQTEQNGKIKSVSTEICFEYTDGRNCTSIHRDVYIYIYILIGMYSDAN